MINNKVQFKKLTKNERRRFLRNVKKSGTDLKFLLENSKDRDGKFSMYHALVGAIMWASTPEGFEYWYNISNRIK